MAGRASETILLVLLILGLVVSGILFVLFVIDSPARAEIPVAMSEPESPRVYSQSNVPLVYDASNDPYPSKIYPEPRSHRSSDDQDSLTHGLFAWFKFDEGSNATSFMDSSGEGNTLSCSGNACPTPGDGRVSGAAAFDGFDTVLLAEDDSSLHSSRSLSIATWVNVNSIRSSWGAIVLKNDGLLDCRAPNDCSNREYGLWVSNDGGAEFDITPESRFGDSKVDCLIPAGSVPFNQWVHLAAVADSTNETMKLYVDGNLVRTCSQPALSSGIHNSDGPLMIGRVVNATWGDGRIGLGGKIDDLRIYNRALSVDEILDLS